MAKVTEKQKQVFLESVRSGSTVKAALEAAGFSKPMITYWRKRWTVKDKDFFDDYNAALDVRAIGNLPEIEDALFQKALKGDMRAIERYLESQGGKRWAKDEQEEESSAGTATSELLKSLEGKSLDERRAGIASHIKGLVSRSRRVGKGKSSRAS